MRTFYLPLWIPGLLAAQNTGAGKTTTSLLDIKRIYVAPLTGGKEAAALRDLIIAGPAAAPLARAESFYRYQIMLRTRQMTTLSQRLAEVIATFKLPDEVHLTVDIDPVDLA